MTALSDVHSGEAHVVAHNDERHAINNLKDLSDTAFKAALDGAYAGLVTGTATGLHKNTDSPTYGKWFTFGNAGNSMGFAGTGTPAEAWAPFVVYQKFGDYAGGTNTPITKSTQAIAVVAPYYGPTADDSAEAGSSSVIMKNTGTAYTHSQQTVAWEANTAVEANVTATGLVTGSAGRVNIAGTANQVVSVRASAQTDASYAGTITSYYAFAQLATPAFGTITNRWGLYVVDKAHSESGLSIGNTGWTGQASLQRTGNTDGASSLMLLKGPDSAPGLTTLSLVQGAGQTKSLQEWRDSSGNTRFAVGATGVPRVAGVVMNFTDGSNVVRMVMDHATGLELKEARNLIFGTATGTMIGTASTQKLGFYGATPVVRPTSIPAAATDAATTQALVNDIRSKLLTLGLVA